MKIAIFTDEINREDPQRALRLAREWGVEYVEVRSLPGGRLPQPPDSELRDFQSMVSDAGLKISGVSPGFFKCPVNDPSVPADLSEGLPRACEWAREWGTDMVSCFGFRRKEDDVVPNEVLDALGRMAEVTGEHGCRMVLENESVCWGDTGLEAAEMIRQIGSQNLTLCWDPGNSARAGSKVPYPDEYEQFRDLVSHVHLKNFDPETNGWQLMEKGIVDWPGQLGALRTDGYEGFLVIETHLSVSPDEFKFIDPDLAGLEANTRRNLEYLRSLLAGR